MHFRRPPSEILSEFSSLDFELLLEWYLDHPFGHEREQIALMTGVIANRIPQFDKVDAITMENLLPQRPAEPRPQQPVDEQLEMARMLVAALGGAANRG